MSLFRFALLFLILLFTTCKPENKKQIIFSSREFKIDYTLFFEDFPYPAWFKDKNSTILAINRKYEYVFKQKLNLNTDLLVGQKGELFDSSTLKTFVTHDNLVRGRRSLLILEENIVVNGKSYKGTSYKFLILNEKNEFEGHMGYWIPADYTLLY